MGYFLTSQRNKASQLAQRLDLSSSLFFYHPALAKEL
jgi:hypothetical protein